MAGLALFILPLAAGAANNETYRQLNLFGDVFERVRADYVEEVSDSELIEAAINGMLSSLDPHSRYLNAKSFEDMQTQTRGEFGGLGIEVTMDDNGFVKVITPIDDTPAQRAGLEPGDFVTHLDGESILGLTLTADVSSMLPGLRTSQGVVVAASTQQAARFRDGQLLPGDVIRALNG